MNRQAPQLLPFLFILIVILLGIALAGLLVYLFIWAQRKADERTRALQMVAGQMGWAFTRVADFSRFPGIGSYSLFTQGRSHRLYNMLYGELDGGRAAVFDYAYTTSHGKSSRRHTLTVAYFQSSKLTLPYFSLGPESFLHKFIGMFGYQDIDFGNRPEFSSHYLLRGQDEQGVRRVFTDGLLSFYETNHLSTDAGRDQFFLYQLDVTVEPQNIQGFIELGRGLANMYKNRW